jgi:hypothetical protein
MNLPTKENFDKIKEGTMFRSNENEVFVVKFVHADPLEQYLEVVEDVSGAKPTDTYICELYCVTNNQIMFSPIQYDKEDEKIYFVITGENERIIVGNIEEFLF